MSTLRPDAPAEATPSSPVVGDEAHEPTAALPADGAVRQTHSLQLHTHQSGRRMVNQYLVLSELGRGVHGRVRQATDTASGQAVAIKIVERATRRRLGSAGADARRRQRTTLTPGTPEAPGQRVPATDDKVLREIAILKKCANDHVVRLLEVIDDPHSKKIFMVLEFMSGGDVQWRDTQFRPLLAVDTIRCIARDVICGLEYLHYNGIIHRDIKPANLLWNATHSHVKISDFGVSHFSLPLFRRGRGLALEYDEGEEAPLDSTRQSTRRSANGTGETDAEVEAQDQAELARTTGSPAFFAPELCLSGERPISTAQCSKLGTPRPDQSPPTLPPTKTGPVFTQTIDIWAFGVTLYCLLFGCLPFHSPSEFALFSVIPWYDYALPHTMGSDQVPVGPRARRWDASYLTSIVHEHDMSTSVSRFLHQDGPNNWLLPSASSTLPLDPTLPEPDAPLNSLSSDALALRDLLDGVMEKDPDMRAALATVKASPWTTRGLPNPQAWIDATDPDLTPYETVYYTDVPDAAAVSKIKKPRSAAGLVALGMDKLHSSHHHRSSPVPPAAPTRRKSESQVGPHLGQRVRESVNRVRARMHRRDSASTPVDSSAAPTPDPLRASLPGGGYASQTVGPSSSPPRGGSGSRRGQRFASLPLSRPSLSQRESSSSSRPPLAQLFVSDDRPSSALSAPLHSTYSPTLTPGLVPSASGMHWRASEPIPRQAHNGRVLSGNGGSSFGAHLSPRPASALDMERHRSIPDVYPPVSASVSGGGHRSTAHQRFPFHSLGLNPATPDLPGDFPSISLTNPSATSANFGETVTSSTTNGTTLSTSGNNGPTVVTDTPSSGVRHRGLPHLIPSRFKLRRQKSTNSLRSRPSVPQEAELNPSAPPSSYIHHTPRPHSSAQPTVDNNPPAFLRSSRRSVTTGHASRPSIGSIGSLSVGLPSIHDMPRFPRASTEESGVLDFVPRATADSPVPSFTAAGQVMSRSFTPSMSRTTTGTPHTERISLGDEPPPPDRPDSTASPTPSLRERLQRFTLHRRQRSRASTTSVAEGPSSRPTSSLSRSPASPPVRPNPSHPTPVDMGCTSSSSSHTAATPSSHSVQMAHTSSGISQAAMHRVASTPSASAPRSGLSYRADDLEDEADAVPLPSQSTDPSVDYHPDHTDEDIDDLSNDELDADLHAAANTGFWHNDGSGWKFVAPEGSEGRDVPPPPLAAHHADPLAHLEPSNQGEEDLVPGVDGTVLASEDFVSPRDSVEGGYNLYKHVDWDVVRSRTPPYATAALTSAMNGEPVGPDGRLAPPPFPPQSYVSPHRPRTRPKSTDPDVDPTLIPLPHQDPLDVTIDSFDTTWSTQRASVVEDGRYSDAEEESTNQHWSASQSEGVDLGPAPLASSSLGHGGPGHQQSSSPAMVADGLPKDIPAPVSATAEHLDFTAAPSSPAGIPTSSSDWNTNDQSTSYQTQVQTSFVSGDIPSPSAPQPTYKAMVYPPANPLSQPLSYPSTQSQPVNRGLPTPESLVNLSSIGIDSVMARVLRNPEMVTGDLFPSSTYLSSDHSLDHEQSLDAPQPRASTPRGR